MPTAARPLLVAALVVLAAGSVAAVAAPTTDADVAAGPAASLVAPSTTTTAAGPGLAPGTRPLPAPAPAPSTTTAVTVVLPPVSLAPVTFPPTSDPGAPAAASASEPAVPDVTVPDVSLPPVTDVTLPPVPETTAPPTTLPPVAPSGGCAAELAERTNAARAAAGLAPLAADGRVDPIAELWSETLAAQGALSHNGGLGFALTVTGVAWRSYGENVGYASTAELLFELLMASPSHRANILSPAFSAVGVGCAAAGDVVWATQDFYG